MGSSVQCLELVGRNEIYFSTENGSVRFNHVSNLVSNDLMSSQEEADAKVVLRLDRSPEIV